MFFLEYFSLVSRKALTSEYDFKSAFIANQIIAVMAGIIGGIFTVNFMEYCLRRFAFWKALLLIITVYIFSALLISAIGVSYIESENFGLPLLHPEVIEEVSFFFISWEFIKQFIIWLFIVVVTLIVLMVNDKYGPGVFPDYLMGRYFIPKKERRIFMFADIKNATGIAEALGEQKYFNFLKDFFRDIAPAIVQTKGEVYQYVGDEVVVSWKMKQGLKHANALQCFYLMKKRITSLSKNYEKKYAAIPHFKVGFHYGSVMVGELGKIKREIAFSGDVLNTTSRIQAKCNALGVDILASESFANINVNLADDFEIISMGVQELRGKTEDVPLVTFRHKN